MVMYAPRDHTNIAVSGGCGNTHDTLTVDGQLVVDCPRCEPIIAGMGHGWAYTPEQVAPTPDETRALDQQRLDAERAQVNTWANPGAFAELMAKAFTGPQPAAPAGPSLVQQLIQGLMTLPAEERAMIGALLNPPTAPAPITEAAPVQVNIDNPAAPVMAAAMMPMLATATTTTAAAAAPVKRGPGRPPKNPTPTT